MKQNKFDISFQIGPWNLESLICNTHMRTRVRACTYTCTYTCTHTQMSANKGNVSDSRLLLVIGRIFDYMSIFMFWSENDIMENVCKEVRWRQTFPWQAVALYGAIGKHAFIKSLLFFLFVQGKACWLAMGVAGKRKEKHIQCFTKCFKVKMFFVSDHTVIFLLPSNKWKMLS